MLFRLHAALDKRAHHGRVGALAGERQGAVDEVSGGRAKVDALVRGEQRRGVCGYAEEDKRDKVDLRMPTAGSIAADDLAC